MGVNTMDDRIYRIEGLDQTIDIAGTPSNYINIPTWARRVNMVCDTAWRLGFGPRLVHALYMTAAGVYTEYTNEVTDETTAHMPLDAMPAGDYVYLGVSDPVLGFYFDIGTGVNANAATVDMEYCSTAMTDQAAIAFTDVAGDSDQTANPGGTPFAIDGEYVFTLVTPKRSRLGTYAVPRFSKCYWYRFTVGSTLSAAVDINQIVPIYQNVTLGFMAAATQYDFVIDRANVGSWYAQCSASKHLFINWIA